jgi:hypothetical protein
MDGQDTNRWSGNWFMPVNGHEYMVPENAGNYASLRGKYGRCRDVRTSSHGHSWALIHFVGKGKIARWIRTSYLMPSKRGEPEERKLEPVRPDVEAATDPVTEKFAAVWDLEWNTGTTSIRGY